MAELRVRLFGEIAVIHRDRPVTFPSAKALELFCYLLLNPDRPHTRESLSEVLWPSGQPGIAKRYLRQALWRFGAVTQGWPDGIVTIGPEVVRMASGPSWWLDVRAAENTYLRTRDTPAHQLSHAQAEDLDAAVDLYRGELMACWYHDWCIEERVRQERIHLAMLEQLIGFCMTRRLHSRGIDYGQQVLHHDPARESTHRLLIRLHHGTGDRTSALRQYERCADALAAEYGIAPSAETAALHEQVRSGRTVDPPQAARPTGGADNLHARLDRLQADLGALRAAVEERLGPLHSPMLVGPRQSVPRRRFDVDDAS
ncbi:AfsR/SARP family transcriptional regulator [Pseudonocardia sp.]|uniref:AfsR/SARP family transcriptional regulator n=1 Tax=Pseudonocardia sp. TaxID=60912 RepID=UPI003D0AC6C9